MTLKPIPTFANEFEEAQWWVDNQDNLDQYLDMSKPRVNKPGELLKRLSSPPSSAS